MGLLILSFASASFFGIDLWKYYKEYEDNQVLYQNLRDEILYPSELDTHTEIKENQFASDIENKQLLVSKKKSPISVNWNQLKTINEEIIGWVYFTGLPQISYPILQAADNEYYLHRTYDLSSDDSKAGSIFMDYRMESDFSLPYSVIYGHNVRDGSMFSDLILLKDQQLYNKEPYFWILTPNGEYRYQVFSIFQCHRSADVFQQFFTTWNEEFFNWESELKNRNSMQGDVKLGINDHVIAFSTCVPNSFDRTIVCGKYLDGDEIPVSREKN